VLSDAELESELLTWAGRVAAGQAVVLRLNGETYQLIHEQG
jgi:hypothetical protein